MVVFLIGLQTSLAFASIYLLLALSLTLILAVSSVFNFVQTTLLMLATIFTFELGVNAGWPAIATIAVLVVFGLAAGAVTHLLLVKPAAGRTTEMLETTLLTTLGAYTAINAVAALAFGSDTRPIPPYAPAAPWVIGSVTVNKTYVVIIAVTIVLVIVFQQVLRRSELGRVTRVTLEDPHGAQLLGIGTNRVVLVSFAIAGALVCVAGWLIAPVLGASAFSAQDLAFYAFAAMAIGGFGSFAGAGIGAIVVGLVEGMVPLYLDAVWTTPLLLAIVAAVLIARPAGLLGAAGLFGSMKVREI